MTLFKVYLRQMGAIDNIFVLSESHTKVLTEVSRRFEHSTVLKVISVRPQEISKIKMPVDSFKIVRVL